MITTIEDNNSTQIIKVNVDNELILQAFYRQGNHKQVYDLVQKFMAEYEKLMNP
jgi:hypothetical protein